MHKYYDNCSASKQNRDAQTPERGGSAVQKPYEIWGFTPATVYNVVFWVVIACSFVDCCRRFWGTFCLHFQVRDNFHNECGSSTLITYTSTLYHTLKTKIWITVIGQYISNGDCYTGYTQKNGAVSKVNKKFICICMWV
jgi:hypothetical protein